jgi:predicted transcriptional regulator
MSNPVAVKLEADLQERLKALGERLERSPHWLMKRAITEFVERAEAEELERRVLLDRWQRYQETGEHIPHETVVKWLETWGSDKERPCPTDRN